MINLNERIPAISIHPDMATREDIAYLASELMELRHAILLSLEYLKICHLANHIGCQIKVDQAIEVLEKAINP